jgi:hypothetical protein
LSTAKMLTSKLKDWRFSNMASKFPLMNCTGTLDERTAKSADG